MPEITAVWIVIAHFTVMGYGGDALPEKRQAFLTESDCRKTITVVRRSFEAMPIKPDKIACERLEIRK